MCVCFVTVVSCVISFPIANQKFNSGDFGVKGNLRYSIFHHGLVTKGGSAEVFGWTDCISP